MVVWYYVHDVKLTTWFVFFVDVIDVDVYDIDSEFIPTPNGHKYRVPNVTDNEKPKKGYTFTTFDDADDEYD